MRFAAKWGFVALSGVLAALSIVWTAAAAAAAPTAPRSKTIASYCSSSGDVCYGIFNRSGKVHLQITTAARYFKRYSLCVRLLPPASDPAHAQRCGSFPVFRQGGPTWGSSVNYARQYPVARAGRYRVTWKLGSSPLGRPLYFRLPLS
jgi:hypothetical protein